MSSNPLDSPHIDVSPEERSSILEAPIDRDADGNAVISFICPHADLPSMIPSVPVPSIAELTRRSIEAMGGYGPDDDTIPPSNNDALAKQLFSRHHI